MNKRELVAALNAKLNHCFFKPHRKYNNIEIPSFNKNESYNVETDPLLRENFKFISCFNKNEFSQEKLYIKKCSFYIAANMEVNAATEEQLSEMMGICDYTAESMNQYAMENIEDKTKCISEPSLLMTVCLLSRALSDAMGDGSIWQMYKNGREKWNYTPTANVSLQKLKELVPWMEERNLLELSYDCEVDYEKFIMAFFLYNSKKGIVQRQENLILDAVEKQKLNITEGITTFEDSRSREVQCLINDFSVYQDNTLSLKKHKKMISNLNPVNVAEGMFSAIISGDDIYRMKSGPAMMEDFIRLTLISFSEKATVHVDESTYKKSNGKGIAEDIITDSESSTALMINYPKEKSLIKNTVQENEPSKVHSNLVRRLKLAKEENEKAIEFFEKNQIDVPPVMNCKEALLDDCLSDDDKLMRICKDLEKENKFLYHKIQKYNASLKEVKKKHKSEKNENQDFKKAEAEDTSVYDASLFPYYTKLNPVLYGGTKNFQKKIRKLFPNIRVVKETNKIDIRPFINADFVIFQTNHMSHSDYYKIKNECDRRGIDYIHMEEDNKADYMKLLKEMKELENRYVEKIS